jgi:hypothetical protein
VKHVLHNKLVSVNGGVFACRPTSPVLPLWHEWTVAARNIFISDETVLHTMMWIFSKSQFFVARGGHYNCSPKYQPDYVKNEEVIVWHFHGDSNTRFKKSPRGTRIWWPEYQQCLKENIGGMADWRTDLRYKYLDALERQIKKGEVQI